MLCPVPEDLYLYLYPRTCTCLADLAVEPEDPLVRSLHVLSHLVRPQALVTELTLHLILEVNTQHVTVHVRLGIKIVKLQFQVRLGIKIV